METARQTGNTKRSLRATIFNQIKQSHKSQRGYITIGSAALQEYPLGKKSLALNLVGADTDATEWKLTHQLSILQL